MKKVLPKVKRKILDRDDWQCRMPRCLHPGGSGGRAIDPGLYGTVSDWAPSVDHIRPKSQGGGNRQENLRAAHWLCNASAAAGWLLAARISASAAARLAALAGSGIVR